MKHLRYTIQLNGQIVTRRNTWKAVKEDLPLLHAYVDRFGGDLLVIDEDTDEIIYEHCKDND